MARRSGLGKGLGSLIPTTEELRESEGQLRELPLSEIVANAYQPRSHFDEEALASLTASIKSLGVIQPILVRELAEDRFELIAGERRWRAAQAAGLDTIPAIVRPAENQDSLEQALVENLHREDLGALEEAHAYQRLAEEFGLSQDQIATKVGKSRSSVANTVRLLQLPDSIQSMVASGALSAGHAKAILGTSDRALQEKLARAVISEKLTVREVEERVRGAEAEQATATTKGATGVATPRAAALLELEELFSDLLDTRVAVAMGAKRGRISIDFSNLEDLERIYRVMVEGKPPSD